MSAHSEPIENEITELTRRDIFDALRLGDLSWSGRLGESALLGRVFDLEKLPSHDHRCRNMLQDIKLHRENFSDWTDENWVFDDGRLNLLRCPDETLLRFLCETVHPLARLEQEEATKLVAIYNKHLLADGFHLVVKTTISGKPVYAGVRTINSVGVTTSSARKVADILASDHVAAQITRMESSLHSDPGLAIGSSKEFIESICKGILKERGVELTGSEDLPKLARLTREVLSLTVQKDTDDTLKKLVSAVTTLVQGVTELRGQLGTGHGADPATQQPAPEIARLSVGVATAVGVFLFELHRSQANENQ